MPVAEGISCATAAGRRRIPMPMVLPIATATPKPTPTTRARGFGFGKAILKKRSLTFDGNPAGAKSKASQRHAAQATLMAECGSPALSETGEWARAGDHSCTVPPSSANTFLDSHQTWYISHRSCVPAEVKVIRQDGRQGSSLLRSGACDAQWSGAFAAVARVPTRFVSAGAYLSVRPAAVG